MALFAGSAERATTLPSDQLVLTFDAGHGARVRGAGTGVAQPPPAGNGGETAWLDATEREVAELGSRGHGSRVSRRSAVHGTWSHPSRRRIALPWAGFRARRRTGRSLRIARRSEPRTAIATCQLAAAAGIQPQAGRSPGRRPAILMVPARAANRSRPAPVPPGERRRF